MVMLCESCRQKTVMERFEIDNNRKHLCVCVCVRARARTYMCRRARPHRLTYEHYAIGYLVRIWKRYVENKK
jgi:hypothetical protein